MREVFWAWSGSGKVCRIGNFVKTFVGKISLEKILCKKAQK